MAVKPTNAQGIAFNKLLIDVRELYEAASSTDSLDDRHEILVAIDMLRGLMNRIAPHVK